MTQANNQSLKLDADLGWALGTILKSFSKNGSQVFAEIPGGYRGYHALLGAAELEGTQLALATKLGIDRTVMTYLLDDLEAAGLIQRQPDPKDRRARRIVVTDLGSAQIAKLKTQFDPIETATLASLTAKEAETLRELARKVAQGVGTLEITGDICSPS